VRPLLGDLAHEVNLCVRHYCVTFRGSRPSGCLVVGGEALEPHLTEAMQDALQIETTVGRPFEDVEGVRTVGDGRDAFPEFGVAAGLSLRPMDVRSAGGRGMMRRGSDHASEDESAPEGRRAA
jgi:Tfp pilus assembly PilM family ATPase